MRIQKRILVPDRLRQLPRTGFSWVDRRFVRDHARALSRDGVLLYFFLAAVSDRHGLSYYGDAATGRILGLTETAVYAARNELQHRDLIAYDAPLYQVLSLAGPVDDAGIQHACVQGLLARLCVQGGES